MIDLTLDRGFLLEVKKQYNEHLLDNYRRTDRIFGWLLPAQWMFAVFCAIVISPYAWSGAESSVHLHVWAAVFLGGILSSVPVLMTYLLPGQWVTRFSVAMGQAMFSSLLIHLMGGRIEAHFHLFVSIALLAAYRDPWVFIPAMVVGTADHFIRGYFWPLSVFGESTANIVRPLEHLAWLLFLTAGMFYVVRQSLQQLMRKSRYQCSLKRERDSLETRVLQRTSQLEEAREFQESVFNSIDAQICIVDSDSKVVFVNQSWIDYADGIDSETHSQFVGRDYLEVNGNKRQVHNARSLECGGENTTNEPDQQMKINDAIQQILAGDIDNYTIEFQCPKYIPPRWFQVSLNRVTHSGKTAVAVVNVDITHMKNVQARADGLATIFMDSPNELFLFDKDSLKFLEVNAGALDNLGYTLGEIREMTPLDIKPKVTPDQFATILQKVNIADGKAVEFETVHRRKDGTTYDTSISLHEAILQGQEVYVAFVTDVTERTQLKLRLLQSQKLESMGQLAAGIAHEINTPMQCVFSNVEFLHNAFERVLAVTDQFTHLLDERQVDWEKEANELKGIRKKSRYDYLRTQTPLALDEAADASKRVISIVRAMKAMSHPGTADKTSSNINELIDNAATITRNRWKYVAEMKYDFDPEVSHVEVLPAEISQVFINMMVNAADSISEKLGAEPIELGEIKIKTRKVGNKMRIDISDTGVGVPEEVHQKIFDPFFTTKEVGKGTGQGLSITYDVVVNKHNGAIDLKSSAGEGATFSLTIPLTHTKHSGIPVHSDLPLDSLTDPAI